MPNENSFLSEWPGAPFSVWTPDRVLEQVKDGKIDVPSAVTYLNQQPPAWVEQALDRERERDGWESLTEFCSMFPGGAAIAFAVKAVVKFGQWLYEQLPNIGAAWDGFCAWIEETGEAIWETLQDWGQAIADWFGGWFDSAEDGASAIADAAGEVADQAEAAFNELTGSDEHARSVWDQEEYDALIAEREEKQRQADEAWGKAQEQAAEGEAYGDVDPFEEEWGGESDPDWDEYGQNEGWDEQDWGNFWDERGGDWLEE